MAVVDILPPEPAPGRVRGTHRGSGTVLDAHFVTVRRSAVRKTRSSTTEDDAGLFRWRGANAPLASLSVTRAEQALSRLSADMFSAVVALVFVLVFALTGGFSLFVGKPAGGQGMAALDFTHVSLTPQDANGMQVLLINGIVENRGQDRLTLPAIRAELVDGQSILSTALIEPPVSEIVGLQSHGFSARIPHPGGKALELRLSFAERDASGS